MSGNPQASTEPVAYAASVLPGQVHSNCSQNVHVYCQGAFPLREVKGYTTCTHKGEESQKIDAIHDSLRMQMFYVIPTFRYSYHNTMYCTLY